MVKNGTGPARLKDLMEPMRQCAVAERLDVAAAVMIKVAKPNQDMRFDVPVIGRETISVAAEAKIRVIALEASRTLLLEKEDVILAAQNAKISLFGR